MKNITKQSGWSRKTHNHHNDKEYRHNRELIRQRDAYCLYCWYVNDLITPMADCDHYIPITVSVIPDHSMTNLQGLCKECHYRKTVFESSGGVGFPNVIDSLTGWNIELPDFQQIIRDRQAAFEKAYASF